MDILTLRQRFVGTVACGSPALAKDISSLPGSTQHGPSFGPFARQGPLTPSLTIAHAPLVTVARAPKHEGPHHAVEAFVV
jgi:hypothetical protein